MSFITEELLLKLFKAIQPSLTGGREYTYLLRKVMEILGQCAAEYPMVKYTYVTGLGDSIFHVSCQIEFEQFPYILSIQTAQSKIGNDFCDTALIRKGNGLVTYDDLGYNKYETNRYYDDQLFHEHLRTVFKYISTYKSTDTKDESNDNEDESNDNEDESTDTEDESTDTPDESTDTQTESTDTQNESTDTQNKSTDTKQSI